MAADRIALHLGEGHVEEAVLAAGVSESDESL